ncbi:uncharacterized protein LOC123532769 [Mercenaria mercenaria]|uniref:uncharacterized protein LOC123532769 n=1 Tax=Mercenaria mercenaria TaxID=6596 RepID=UPI00234E5957|nr:uncharacterized protein LOC123532769 [Mercenaria mercenaria]XP_053373257.1 uncharacterized protein LOC123532769 [Mercenaria mercenaria]
MYQFVFIVCLSVLNRVDYTECTLPDGKVGMCYNKMCHGKVNDAQRENLTFTIVVKYPESVLHSHGRTTLYIRGNGLCLNWNKGKRLSKISNDTWGINITYKSVVTKYQCQTRSKSVYLPGNKLQYRVLADDCDDMVGANFSINLPISKTSLYFVEKPVFISYPWFYQKTGVISSFLINSTYIGKERNETMYTPPSFNENTYKTYPVVFVLDLDLHFAKYFKNNLEGPIYPHAVSEEYAIIGFGDYRNDGKERYDLLAPIVSPFLFSNCINGTFEDNCDGCVPENATYPNGFIPYLLDFCGRKVKVGGVADNMLDFLVKEALPFANKLALTRLQSDNLGIMGYSLGGLMSCYAVWTRPNVFSFAACQSSPFFWPINNSSYFEFDFHFINKTLKNPLFHNNRPEQKIYLDVGGGEFPIASWNMVQATLETASIITDFEHYTLDKNVWVHVHPFKNHSAIEWGKRMGQALATLLPAGETQRIPSRIAAHASGREKMLSGLEIGQMLTI